MQSGLKPAAWSSFSQSGGLLQSAASIYVDNNRHDQWIALRLSFKTELFSAVAQRAACHHLPGVCQLSITPCRHRAGNRAGTASTELSCLCPCTARTRATLHGKTPRTLKCEFCKAGEELDPFSIWDRFNVALRGTDSYQTSVSGIRSNLWLQGRFLG